MVRDWIDEHVPTASAHRATCSTGFFDSRSAPVGGATALLEHAEEGDTLLLLALRSCDARSALVLTTIGASLQEANSAGETPLRLLFQAYATIKLRDKQHLDDDSSMSQHQLRRAGSTRARDDRILSKRTEFIALFAHVQDSIDSFYAALKAKIRGELEAIYAEFAPERMSKLSTQMDDFEYNEQALLEGVRRKYLTST